MIDVDDTIDRVYVNTAIAERVREINHDIRRADGTTRWERFEAEEAPLPADRFEEVGWKELKAGRNEHLLTEQRAGSVHVGVGTGARWHSVSGHVRRSCSGP